MSTLKLIPASERRATGDWSADDYDVVLIDTGETVGRIHGRTSAGMGERDWWWGLAFPQRLMHGSVITGWRKAKKPRNGPLRSGGMASFDPDARWQINPVIAAMIVVTIAWVLIH